MKAAWRLLSHHTLSPDSSPFCRGEPGREGLAKKEGQAQSCSASYRRRRKRRASPRSPRRRSSDHAQCRLLLGHHRSSFPWDRKPCFQPPPHPHCTLPHQLQALRHPREQGLAQSLCPPSQHTYLPSPDKANFPLSRSLPCCALPWRCCSLGSFFCRSLLLCCSWLPCTGSWEHSLALKGPSPISIQTNPTG